jgi:hypothetical protein
LKFFIVFHFWKTTNLSSKWLKKMYVISRNECWKLRGVSHLFFLSYLVLLLVGLQVLMKLHSILLAISKSNQNRIFRSQRKVTDFSPNSIQWICYSVLTLSTARFRNRWCWFLHYLPTTMFCFKKKWFCCHQR